MTVDRAVSPGDVLCSVGDSRDDVQCARDTTTDVELSGPAGEEGRGDVATDTCAPAGAAWPPWVLSLAARLDPMARAKPESEPGLEEGVPCVLSGEEVLGRVAVPHSTHGHRSSLREVFATLRAYVGPGLLIAVGYMDPGNWSTNLAGGSAFGYDLLCVIVRVPTRAPGSLTAAD